MSDSNDAASPIDARLWLQPSKVAQGAAGGTYYWVFVAPENQGEAGWGAFQKQNPTVKAVKIQGDLFVLQNIGTNAVLWTLPGFPSVAPKGAATTTSDIVQSPPPEKNLLDRLYDAFYGPDGFFHELGFVSKVAIYGGIGVGLYSLYRHLNPPEHEKSEPHLLPSGSPQNTDEASPSERQTLLPPPPSYRPHRTSTGTLTSRYR